jgi:hypothetical protein
VKEILELPCGHWASFIDCESTASECCLFSM